MKKSLQIHVFLMLSFVLAASSGCENKGGEDPDSSSSETSGTTETATTMTESETDESSSSSSGSSSSEESSSTGDPICSLPMTGEIFEGPVSFGNLKNQAVNPKGAHLAQDGETLGVHAYIGGMGHILREWNPEAQAWTTWDLPDEDFPVGIESYTLARANDRWMGFLPSAMGFSRVRQNADGTFPASASTINGVTAFHQLSDIRLAAGASESGEIGLFAYDVGSSGPVFVKFNSAGIASSLETGIGSGSPRITLMTPSGSPLVITVSGTTARMVYQNAGGTWKTQDMNLLVQLGGTIYPDSFSAILREYGDGYELVLARIVALRVVLTRYRFNSNFDFTSKISDTSLENTQGTFAFFLGLDDSSKKAKYRTSITLSDDGQFGIALIDPVTPRIATLVVDDLDAAFTAADAEGADQYSFGTFRTVEEQGDEVNAAITYFQDTCGNLRPALFSSYTSGARITALGQE